MHFAKTFIILSNVELSSKAPTADNYDCHLLTYIIQ